MGTGATYSWDPRDVYLITGITGTLGQEVASQLKASTFCDVWGVSRDEKKQVDLKRSMPELKTCIGDIRSERSLRRAVRRSGCTKILHFAALKHVDIMEMHPEECIETNINGTLNVLSMGLPVIFTSTDKACEPINVYGQCKAISERLVLNHQAGGVVCRYGNVVGSRGSVIHKFSDLIQNDRVVPITDLSMTRFWITIQDAAAFVISHIDTKTGLQIPALKAAPLMAVVSAIARYHNKEAKTEVVGLRPGEKIHESLRPGETSEKRTLSDDELDEMVRGILG